MNYESTGAACKMRESRSYQYIFNSCSGIEVQFVKVPQPRRKVEIDKGNWSLERIHVDGTHRKRSPKTSQQQQFQFWQLTISKISVLFSFHETGASKPFRKLAKLRAMQSIWFQYLSIKIVFIDQACLLAKQLVNASRRRVRWFVVKYFIDSM